MRRSVRPVSKTAQTRIAGLLKQWSKLRGRAERINAERDQKLQPIKTRFEQRCAPIHAAANEKLEPINEEMSRIEKEVEDVFLTVVRDGDNFKFTRVPEATAVAEVITRTEREIDAEAFFNAVPPAQRTKAFYSCFKTLIGKAEKFLGADRVNLLAHAKRNHTVQIREAK
jgi:hypothetical protein